MAIIGAKFPCFAPFAKEETTQEMPTYEKGVVIGSLVTANLAVTLASGEIYGDDIIQEKMDEFASGSIPMETVDIEDDAKITIYGLEKNDNGEIGWGKNDETPLGGLAYYKSLVRQGKRFYRACFYPKVQAVVGSDNATTRGSSISFQTDTTTFNILPPLCVSGKWKYEQTFDLENDAIEYVKKKLNMTVAPPAPIPPKPQPEG